MRKEGWNSCWTPRVRSSHSEAELAVTSSTFPVAEVARDAELHLLEILVELDLDSGVILAESDGAAECVSGAVALGLPALL